MLETGWPASVVQLTMLYHTLMPDLEREASVVTDDTILKVFLLEHMFQLLRMLKVILDEALEAIQKQNKTQEPKELKIAIRHSGCCGFGGRSGCDKQFSEYISELINANKLLVHVSHLTG